MLPQSLFKPLTLYLLCARVKLFLRSGGGGGVVLAMAAGLGHVAHNTIAALSRMRGKDGTAWPEHWQLRPEPADLQGGSSYWFAFV